MAKVPLFALMLLFWRQNGSKMSSSIYSHDRVMEVKFRAETPYTIDVPLPLVGRFLIPLQRGGALDALLVVG